MYIPGWPVIKRFGGAGSLRFEVPVERKKNSISLHKGTLF